MVTRVGLSHHRGVHLLEGGSILMHQVRLHLEG
jgi:hypothetical protein